MKMKYSLFLLSVFTAAVILPAETVKQVLDSPELMGISRFRAHWDTPVMLDANGPTEITDQVVTDRGGAALWKPGTPGPIAFDALNRSILVRFPDAAGEMAARIAEGYEVEKIELILPFKDEELWPVGRRDFPGPDGYNYRTNFGVDRIYRAIRPRWHAVAWTLRKPWQEDAETGPTYNAAINGRLYWKKYGAQDTTEDRFPTMLGPVEVSYQVPEGRLDITSAVLDAPWGGLEENLRQFADCGLLLRKEETYDHRYYRDVYEWATATGGRAILIDLPRLEITYREGDMNLGEIPPAADLTLLEGGEPTALLPDAESILAKGRKFDERPEWASPAHWERIRQLAGLKMGSTAEDPIWFLFTPKHLIEKFGTYRWQDGEKVTVKPPDPYQVYVQWLDSILGRQPRGWGGFEASLEMAQWHLGKELMPAPVQDAYLEYWTAWMMPERISTLQAETLSADILDGRLVHPMVDHLHKNPTDAFGTIDSYYQHTGDWRGNKSFYRSGFTYVTSTQNFNTTSTIGALLGGEMVGSDRAIADGRNGFETFLLRQWNWNSGSSQEHIDHYYYAVSMKGYKTLYDYLDNPLESLMAASLMAKANQELISTYHPNLKRFIAGSSRTSLAYVLGKQDGLNYILHTVMDDGALTDLDGGDLPEAIPAFGQEFKPEQVALQSLSKPWMPEWQANLLNHRTFPHLTVMKSGQAIRTIYQGEHFGLSSDDRSTRRIQMMGQWRRKDAEVTSMRDVGTLLIKSGYNDTRFVSDAPGWINAHGSESAYQKENKLLVISSPRAYQGGLAGGEWIDDLTRFSSRLVLFSYESPEPSWRSYVDEKEITTLPVDVKPGQHLLIHDGVSYLAITPVPGPRDGPGQGNVMLREGSAQTSQHTKLTHKPALMMDYMIHEQAEPLARDGDWYGLDQRFVAYAIELGDEASFGSFDAFSKHILSSSSEATFDAETRTATVSYTSGGDHMVLQSVTANPQDAEGKWDSTLAGNVKSRQWNGQEDTLPGSFMVDGPNTQIAWGDTEKAGANVHNYPVTGKGKRSALQVDPVTETFVAWNPLPELRAWRFDAPGGYTVRSDGAIGITQVVLKKKKGELHLRHHWKGNQAHHPSAASAMLVQAPKSTRLFLNQVPLDAAKIETRQLQGASWSVIPLREDGSVFSTGEMETRLNMIENYPAAHHGGNRPIWFNDVWYCGPFPAGDQPYGPERTFAKEGKIDVETTYPDETHPDYKPEARFPQVAHWRQNRTQRMPFADLQNAIHASSNGHPCNLNPQTTQNVYYVLLQLESDERKKVGFYHILHADGQNTKKIWLNGNEIQLTKPNYGLTPMELRQGINRILIRVGQTSTRRWGDKLGVQIGDPVFGTPNITGVRWIGTDGSRIALHPKEIVKRPE